MKLEGKEISITDYLLYSVSIAQKLDSFILETNFLKNISIYIKNV